MRSRNCGLGVTGSLRPSWRSIDSCTLAASAGTEYSASIEHHAVSERSPISTHDPNAENDGPRTKR